MENNKSIGLVLSGGGYKGLAHAGTLHFLEEKNITINALAGTSAGSIVSCLYASGMAPQDILGFFKSVNLFNWQYFTFKKPGLLDVNYFDKFLVQIFGDKTLKDLNIPVYITATDIAKGETHIFDFETKVVDAILASSAFPGVFSPYEIDGKLYSDGGILNNFPTNILRENFATIIGVNVCPIQTINKNQLSSIRAVTFRAYDLMTATQNIARGKLCDWLIEPRELVKYSTFERNKQKMDQIYDIGYQTAQNTYQENKDKIGKAIL